MALHLSTATWSAAGDTGSDHGCDIAAFLVEQHLTWLAGGPRPLDALRDLVALAELPAGTAAAHHTTQIHGVYFHTWSPSLGAVPVSSKQASSHLPQCLRVPPRAARLMVDHEHWQTLSGDSNCIDPEAWLHTISEALGQLWNAEPKLACAAGAVMQKAPPPERRQTRCKTWP